MALYGSVAHSIMKAITRSHWLEKLRAYITWNDVSVLWNYGIDLVLQLIVMRSRLRLNLREL